MSRIIWEDLWGAARERAKARLRAEYRLTATRFGTVLPEHLAAYSRRMRGRPPGLIARRQVSCNALFLSLSAAPGRH